MKKMKRILALAVVILLAALYLATLIFALIGSDWAFGMFKACLALTIVLPVLLYGYFLIYRILKNDNDKKE